MVTTDPSDIADSPVVLAFSDAGDNISAIHEIDEWAFSHGFVRSREYQLNIRQSKDGKRWFYGACHRLTEDDKRAAQLDLERIRKRREAMPVTIPSDQLTDGDS